MYYRACWYFCGLKSVLVLFRVFKRVLVSFSVFQCVSVLFSMRPVGISIFRHPHVDFALQRIVADLLHLREVLKIVDTTLESWNGLPSALIRSRNAKFDLVGKTNHNPLAQMDRQRPIDNYIKYI